MCGRGGFDIMTCDGCEAIFHMGCVGLSAMPVGEWLCSACDVEGGAGGCSSAAAGSDSDDGLAAVAARRGRLRAWGSRRRAGGYAGGAGGLRVEESPELPARGRRRVLMQVTDTQV